MERAAGGEGPYVRGRVGLGAEGTLWDGASACKAGRARRVIRARSLLRPEKRAAVGTMDRIDADGADGITSSPDNRSKDTRGLGGGSGRGPPGPRAQRCAQTRTDSDTPWPRGPSPYSRWLEPSHACCRASRWD